jgi:hypothetical protein
MTDPRPPDPRAAVIHGLVVPADAHRRAHLTPLGSAASGRQLSIIAGLIGRDVTVEQTRYDRDAVILVDEEGMARQLAVNVPVTAYIKTRSDAARVHAQRAEGWPADYLLVGDVVIVGCDVRSPDLWTNVPERFLSIFGVTTGDA